MRASDQTALRALIEQQIGVPVNHFSPLSGGDIAEVYRVTTAGDPYVMKVQRGDNAAAMLLAEADGLRAIRDTGTIGAPLVAICTEIDSGALLLMEAIETRRAGTEDMSRFGHALAQMHLVTYPTCGWQTDNYIGSLPQHNHPLEDWTVFYLRMRLLPQFKMARDRGLLFRHEIPSEETLNRILSDFFPDVIPALLHGDLWNGNFLVRTDGMPYLIDPAVCYGHFEMDLAMTRLFGGFGQAFYDAHADMHPVAPGADARNEIYQLYYLLVHLNLFGAGYHGQVSRILQRYF